jgi:hypothetical protein
MSATFAHDLLKYMPLTPIAKLLKILLGHILLSLGILYVLPIHMRKAKSPLLVHMKLMLIVECLLDYVMLQLLFKDA